MFTPMTGTLWSSCRITVRPFGSVNIVYGTEIAAVARGACAAAGAAAGLVAGAAARRRRCRGRFRRRRCGLLGGQWQRQQRRADEREG